MKRKGNLLPQIAEFDNLYFAFYKACLGKQHQPTVLAYSADLDNNIKKLQAQLLCAEVEVGNYEYFTIIDPKKRQICAASFAERVLHHGIMNVCHSVFESHFISDTYATRKYKGIYRALCKARAAMLNYRFVAKLDVRKYFDSIDHQILKTKLKRLFKDEGVLQIFNQIIDSYHKTTGRGIPIGNLTSQYFANYYLSAADHFAKQELQMPCYLRYMDDILFFDHEKESLGFKLNRFCDFVHSTLGLQFNPITVNKVELGISYLGYKLYPHLILLNRRSRLRFKRKFLLYGRLLSKNKLSQNAYQHHIVPLLSFSNHAYTKKMRWALLKRIK